MATDRNESIEAAARAYADSMGHGDACDLTLYGACDMTLYGEEYRCDCGYAALRSALAQPAAPYETSDLNTSGPGGRPLMRHPGPKQSCAPAPEATGAGEPVAWVVTRKDGSVRSAYVRKSAAESDCDLLNTPCGIDSTLVLEARPYRVVPLYAHPTPPRAEGVERADRVVALEDSIRRWHHEKYGRAALIAPTVRKLGEEFGEFCEAAVKGDVPAMTEEAADVALILTNLVRAVGGGSLFDAMETKHEVCKQRLAAERGEG